ncbi:hypothetical protein D9M70_474690 [compost metagenome]
MSGIRFGVDRPVHGIRTDAEQRRGQGVFIIRVVWRTTVDRQVAAGGIPQDGERLATIQPLAEAGEQFVHAALAIARAAGDALVHSAERRMDQVVRVAIWTRQFDHGSPAGSGFDAHQARTARLPQCVVEGTRATGAGEDIHSLVDARRIQAGAAQHLPGQAGGNGLRTEVVHRHHQALGVDREGVAGNGAGIDEGGEAQALLRGDADQGAMAAQLREAVFVMGDQGAAGRRAEHGGAAVDALPLHEIAPAVPQEDLFQRQLQPGGQALELCPVLWEAPLHGSAHRARRLAARQARQVLPERQHTQMPMHRVATEAAETKADLVGAATEREVGE